MAVSNNVPICPSIPSSKWLRVVPYLQDLCAQDSSRCPQVTGGSIRRILLWEPIRYSFLIWCEWVGFRGNLGYNIWRHVDIPSEYILALCLPDDTNHSNTRVREFWKYGTSVGISGNPQALVNGVMLEDYPTSTESGWLFLMSFIHLLGRICCP